MNIFDTIIKENQDVKTTYKNKELILLNMRKYDGPITMQYLPVGGIQSVFDNKIIVNTLNGFMFCDIVIYDSKLMSSKEFISLFDNLVNEVLPN